jgi:ribosomal protein L33
MAARWYYARDKSRMGPFSAAEMQAMASSGAVLPEDTVWREGVERGVPARKVKNLFTAPSGAGPAGGLPPPAAAAAPAVASTPAASPRPEEAAGQVPPSSAIPAVPGARTEEGGRPAAPARTGRATAGKGAVIIGQDGVNVKVRKKCTECGHLDSSWVTMPIRTGTTKLTFYCRKCRKARHVEVVGHLS